MVKYAGIKTRALNSGISRATGRAIRETGTTPFPGFMIGIPGSYLDVRARSSPANRCFATVFRPPSVPEAAQGAGYDSGSAANGHEHKRVIVP
jgi:hypothetical protein